MPMLVFADVFEYFRRRRSAAMLLKSIDTHFTSSHRRDISRFFYDSKSAIKPRLMRQGVTRAPLLTQDTLATPLAISE